MDVGLFFVHMVCTGNEGIHFFIRAGLVGKREGVELQCGNERVIFLLVTILLILS